VAVTQGSNTGTLETTLTGATETSIVIYVTSGTFTTGADLVIGGGSEDRTIAHANIDAAVLFTVEGGTAGPTSVADVRTTPVTVCTDVYCPDNTVRDTSGNCCACAAGKTRNLVNSAAGNLAAYEDEQKASVVNDEKFCTATTCLVNTYNTGSTPATATAPYSTSAAAFSCQACPTGKVTDAGDDASDAAQGMCHDVACGQDKIGTATLYHKFDHTTNTCIACKSWETAPEGILTTADASTVCTPLSCTVDQYVAADATHTCTDCEKWEESAIQTRASPTTCTVKSCAADEWVDATHADNICRACPAGFTSSAMLRTDTTGIAACAHTTAAHTNMCAANHYVKSHACVPCATGFTNALGDNPLGVDTVCDAVAPAAAATPAVHTLCAADEHVVNHACAACPMGTTNAVGDDTHYHDTACKATLCKENFRVDCTGSGATKACVCVACNADNNADLHWTNTAGDDCSKGVSTVCV
jgi:hypothetical protein